MKKPVNAVFSVIALIVLFFMVQMIGGFILGLYCAIQLGGNVSPEMVTEFIMSNVNILVMISYSLLIFITWLLLVIRKVRFKEYISFKNVDIKHLPLLACFALALQSVSMIFLRILNNIYPIESSYNEMFNSIQSGGLLMTIISIGLMAPIAEEIFFRGVVFKKLKNHMNLKVAILIQAFLFAAIHMNAAQFGPTFLLGCVAAYMYEKSHNIMIPIAYHILFNLYAVFAAYSIDSILIFMEYSSYVATVISGFVIIRAIKRNRTNFEDELQDTESICGE